MRLKLKQGRVMKAKKEQYIETPEAKELRLREEGYCDLLKGIEGELEIKPKELSSILKIPYTTLNDYLRSGRIPFKKPTGSPERDINLFVEFYTNIMGFKGDPNSVREWLRSPHRAFNNEAPIEIMKNDAFGLNAVNNYLESIMDV